MLLTSMLFSVALIAGQQVPPPVQAQDASGPDVLEDVVVEGRRQPPRAVDRMVRDFVDDVTDPPRGRGVARWNRQVCVGVANLNATVAQPMLDRISQAVLDAGLEPGEPGCRPQVLVIATSNGQEMARGLVQARPRAFRTGIDGTSQSYLALRQFQTNEDAVRWWHVSMPVVADTGAPAVRTPPDVSPVISKTPGRLTTPIRNDLQRVFVIVDFEKASGLTLDQLSDYIAMVALSQIDPQAELQGYDTILNLFDASEPPEGLTDWDRSYLSALYSVELNQATARAQAGAVGSAMSRERRGLSDRETD